MAGRLRLFVGLVAVLVSVPAVSPRATLAADDDYCDDDCRGPLCHDDVAYDAADVAYQRGGQ